MAFGADGATLYEAGWDKLVRVWRRDARTGRFTLDPASTLRIPIGPGDAGVLNALAVSADGAWLAVGGNAVLPEDAGFRQIGLVLPRDSVADPLAQGIIYVFDLRANPPLCRQLRGHRGPVWALAFAATPRGRQPRLLSAGEESDPRDPKRQRLVLRLWDVEGRTELDRAAGGELRGIRPRLAAWSVAPDHTRIRAAAAWTSTSFLVWDAGVVQPKLVNDPHSRGDSRGRSTTLSYLPGRGMILTGHFGIPPEGRLPEGYLDSWDGTAPAAPINTKASRGRPVERSRSRRRSKAYPSPRRSSPPGRGSLKTCLRSSSSRGAPKMSRRRRWSTGSSSSTSPPSASAPCGRKPALWGGPRSSALHRVRTGR